MNINVVRARIKRYISLCIYISNIVNVQYNSESHNKRQKEKNKKVKEKRKRNETKQDKKEQNETKQNKKERRVDNSMDEEESLE